MAIDNNVVFINGNATKDVELRKTSSGDDIASMTVAVNGYNDRVSYIDTILWGKNAEIASKYVTKGK